MKSYRYGKRSLTETRLNKFISGSLGTLDSFKLVRVDSWRQESRDREGEASVDHRLESERVAAAGCPQLCGISYPPCTL